MRGRGEGHTRPLSWCLLLVSATAATACSSTKAHDDTESCQYEDGGPCPLGENNVTCPAGTSPGCAFGGCTAATAGTDKGEYCCLFLTIYICSAAPGCTPPAQGYACPPGGPSPATLDPSLTCAAPFTDPNGNAQDCTSGDQLYCCTGAPGADGG